MVGLDNKSIGVTFNYTGCNVLVTGGTQGIGNAIARAYAQAGALVTITGTQPGPGHYAADLSAFDYRRLQVTDNDNIKAVADSLPALDILINNAGASLKKEDEYKTDIFEKSVRVNLFSAFHMANACRDKLAASALPGGGSVIAIASMTSFFGNDIVPGYGAAKAGLVQLTKSLAMGWGGYPIRVNAVAVGLTATPMTADAVSRAEVADPYLLRTPLKRLGRPGDISGAVLFLSSPSAAYITGATLVVDGGFSVTN